MNPNMQGSLPNAQLAAKCRFDLEERSLGFSVRILRLADPLPNPRTANHIAGQLLRCGYLAEVEAAECRKGFVHKLKLHLKELRETLRELRLLTRSSMLPDAKMSAILNEHVERWELSVGRFLYFSLSVRHFLP
jgi:four helix bundle protein